MSDDYKYKLDHFLFPLIANMPKPKILEPGVQTRISTHKFLEICNNNDGYFYSVDVDDCSNVSNDPRWVFMNTRDDNFDFIKN